MALPLPKVIPDVGPGGGLVTSLGGINALNNALEETAYNRAKAQYAPTSLAAEAASKLAYANLMGPQFMAKLMANNPILANMTEPEKQNALQMVMRAAGGQGTGNALMQQQQLPNGVGQPSTNSLSGMLSNGLKNIFGHKQQQYFANPPQQQPMGAPRNAGVPQQGQDDLDTEILNAYERWQSTPQGQRALKSGDRAQIPNADEVLAWDRANRGQQNVNPRAMQQPISQEKPKTFAENTGEFLGVLKQGEKAGEYRAQALSDIGKSQLGLANSGAVLDRMVGIVKNPIFQEMRSKIPFFQDKQLSWIRINGTPEQKELIGDFITTAEKFIESTVNSFSGRPLVREFDLAKRQKISDSDSVKVAEGKLRAAISLKNIAEQKNDIVATLLEQNYSEADAVKMANKLVDVSKIEKETNERLKTKPTDADIKFMAEKYKISEDEVKKRLAEKGY